MKICDICQKKLEDGNYYEYTDDEWVEVVRNGFSIFREDLRLSGGMHSFAQMASQLGTNPAEVEAVWRDMVINRRLSGGMALCPDCEAKVRPFRKR
jgi:hypothetical protein